MQQAESKANGDDLTVVETTEHYAAQSVDETLQQLGTSPKGLSPKLAAKRLAEFGPNRLPKVAGKPWYIKFVQNFIHFFALMLWAGAGMAWLAGLPELSLAIIIVIVVNGIFSYWQEYQAERAAEALQALLPRQVTVRRNGTEHLISAEKAVPGDILILTEGEAVPADARIIRAEELSLDLSSLTGESRPVPRTVSNGRGERTTPTSLSNFVFAGTSIARGRGEAVVVSTGSRTEFGRIAELTQAQDEDLSPLQKEMKRVTRTVTALAVGLGILFFVIGTLFGGLSTETAVIFAIGIIVANVPEGLLPTLTLSLAFGVKRMSKRRALIKRLSAVETLGATTVILTDKTGTLTENEMTVREICAAGTAYDVSGNGYGPTGEITPAQTDAGRAAVTDLLRTAALCCDARLVPPHRHGGRWIAIGDPTEAAILAAAEKQGLTRETLEKYERLAELPFDSTRKRMSTIQLIDGTPVACVKGAISEMLPLCSMIAVGSQMVELTAAQQQSTQAAHDAMADKGYRVLAVARRSVDESVHGTNGWDVSKVERGLTLLGLIAMEDPPRKEVPAAIAGCREAGIRVVMVTGDDGLTASAIGREIGLHDTPPHVITGQMLTHLSDSELSSFIKSRDILFARVAPEQKLRLVETCQKLGEVVAVTGDGVNDAPALKKADIGVAMGATGTDVAREAADMVLTDDNFANIIAAIEEGRAVYDNIRKFVVYVFVSNAAEMVPFVLFILFNVPLPLTIMQVLAVDIGTDLFPALALGAERPELDVMRRAPRKRSERLLDARSLVRAYAWLGMIQAALAISGFYYAQWLAGWRPGGEFVWGGTAYLVTTTVTFAGIVMGQVGNAFCCRSDRQSVFRMGIFSNRLLLWAIAAELAMTLSLIYIPGVARIFNMAPLGVEHWLFICTFGIILLLLEELRKAFAR